MNERRTVICKVRLNADEQRLFMEKAGSYDGNVSAMVRDAVRLLDDKGERRQIEAMATLLSFYKIYQQQLSWLGSNFNQSMHQANELALAGELRQGYYDDVLLPKTKEAVALLRELKAELDRIHDKMESQL
ncbi:MAG: hypothetical protein ACI4T9_01040 [Prevotella sp.]